MSANSEAALAWARAVEDRKAWEAEARREGEERRARIAEAREERAQRLGTGRGR